VNANGAGGSTAPVVESQRSHTFNDGSTSTSTTAALLRSGSSSTSLTRHHTVSAGSGATDRDDFVKVDFDSLSALALADIKAFSLNSSGILELKGTTLSSQRSPFVGDADANG